MPRMDRLSSYHTTVEMLGGVGRVVYHSTPIVIWTEDSVTLNTGGWDTVTTRRKMEQASRQFDLGYHVFRRDGESLVRLPSGKEKLLKNITQFKRKAA